MTNAKNLLIKHRIPILIFLLSLIMGFFWGHKFFFRGLPDSNDQMIYSGLAINMLTEHEYTWGDGYESGRPPGYPLFIAAIYAVTDFNPVAVRFSQLFIFGIISVMVYLLGRKLFNVKVGIMSGVFCAVWWGIGNYANIMTREILIVFFSLITLWLLYLAGEKMNIKYFVYVGLSLGFFTLIHPVPQYLILFVAVNFVFILKRKVTTKKILLSLTLMIFAFLLVLVPWAVRNYIKNDGLGASISPRTGSTLVHKMDYADMLYPQKYKFLFGYFFGFYFAEKIWPDLDIYAIWRRSNEQQENLEEQGYSIGEIDRIQTAHVGSRIMAEPQKFIYKVFIDFVNFNSPLIPKKIFNGNDFVHFTFASGRFSGVPDYIKSSILLVFRLWWYSFLALVVYGFWKNRKKWDKVGWLLVLALYFNAVFSAIHAQPRFAAPIYPIYLIMAAVGLFELLDVTKRRYLQKNKY